MVMAKLSTSRNHIKYHTDTTGLQQLTQSLQEPPRLGNMVQRHPDNNDIKGRESSAGQRIVIRTHTRSIGTRTRVRLSE